MPKPAARSDQRALQLTTKPTRLTAAERKRLARPTQSASVTDIMLWRSVRRELGELRQQLEDAPRSPEGRQQLPEASVVFTKHVRTLVAAVVAMQNERIRTGHLPDDTGFIRDEVDQLAGACFAMLLWLVEESVRRMAQVRPLESPTRCAQFLSESYGLLRSMSRKEHDAMRRALEDMPEEELRRLAASGKQRAKGGRKQRAELLSLSGTPSNPATGVDGVPSAAGARSEGQNPEVVQADGIIVCQAELLQPDELPLDGEWLDGDVQDEEQQTGYEERREAPDVQDEDA